MKAALVIARRELRSYFNSPLAYVFIASLLLSSAIFFYFLGGFYAANRAGMRSYFALFPVLLAVLVPALTMKLWAEERRQGSYELLMTLPFTEAALAIGKHLAAWSVIAIALVATLPVPLMVGLLGRLDWGVVAAEYLGALLLGSAYAAVGQYLSSLTRNQMSAFMAGAAALLALGLVYQLAVWLDLPPWLAGAVNWLSLGYRFISFSRGVIDSRDIVYFGLVSAAALYLTAKRLYFSAWS